MHIKLIMPGAYDYGEPILSLVKVSSRGLLGADRADFIKRASAEMAHRVDQLREKLAADEPLIHLLAVGATEDYGANRNGDGFRRLICQQFHNTFEKYAFFFRNHKNKDPRKSYGRVVKSAWHDPMKRIELLCALNGSEEAARRNKGLFADKEMEKLASGKDIPVSMACKVPYDVCSYCHNRAPSTEDYCWGTDAGGMCKAGGLRDNIGALVEIDGGIHQLHADNTLPTFFDISHVFRPADRIAYVMGQLEKAAHVNGRRIKSAELARELGVSIPYELLVDSRQPANVQRMLKLAYQLADQEAEIEQGALPISQQAAIAVSPKTQVSEGAMPLPPLFREKFAVALRAMADARICLPLARFIEVAADYPTVKAAEAAEIVARELPGIYSRLLTTDLPAKLQGNAYVPSACEAPPALHQWAQKQAADLSLAWRHVRTRTVRAALRLEDPIELHDPVGSEKTANDRDPARKMAEEYAMYKLAFLGSIPESDPDLPLTQSLVVVQNYVQ